MEKLKDYINREYAGSPSSYANDKAISKQQVNEWLRHEGYHMHDNKLFLLRKDFNKQEDPAT